jgi:hypothetical protein
MGRYGGLIGAGRKARGICGTDVERGRGSLRGSAGTITMDSWTREVASMFKVLCKLATSLRFWTVVTALLAGLSGLVLRIATRHYIATIHARFVALMDRLWFFACRDRIRGIMTRMQVRLRTALSQNPGAPKHVLAILAVRFRYGRREEPDGYVSLLPPMHPCRHVRGVAHAVS